MNIKSIACFSAPILLFSSNLFADDTHKANPYRHCFQNPYYQHTSSAHEEALAIGECFYLAAENILLSDYKHDHNEIASSRTHVISALQYADSWFRLAIQKGSMVAVSYLHHTELYLLEDQDEHARQNLSHLSNADDIHATTY